MAEPTIQQSVVTCPYLGLYDDSSIVRTMATKSHRCYARLPGASIELDHQDSFCLTDAHSTCQFFVPLTAEGIDPGRPVASASAVRGRRRAWAGTGLAVVAVAVLGYLLFVYGSDLLRLPEVSSMPIIMDRTQAETATPWQAPATAEGTVTAVPADLAGKVAETETTPTPEAVSSDAQADSAVTDQVLSIRPRGGAAGWWASDDNRRNHLGDSFLYVGQFEDRTYIAAAQFDLSRVPRGAPIHAANISLTGLRDDRFSADVEATWLVQLVAEDALNEMASADFLTAYSAPAAITLPLLDSGALGIKQINQLSLASAPLKWLEQQILSGAQSVSVRVIGDTGGAETLFAWDSGLGPETAGNAPILELSLGAAPPTPPPLPTKPFVVATLTPVPENIVTIVAMASTATRVAESVGTYTPVPYDVHTPTPFPENLATVQANALMAGLPPVVVETPPPVNDVESTIQAEYATAVAVTTGTFTPVPTDAVTPVLILPSPPPENVATAAARVLEATAEASALLQPTPTPLPHNAIIAEFVYATSTPGSAEAAVALARQIEDKAKVDGTATPLPWNAVVITSVPAYEREPTPIPLFVASSEFTPTPTPTELPPDVLPDFVRNKIVFKSNRSGREGVYVLDPSTGDVSLVTQSWVYPLAARDVALAPDGRRYAQVGNDDRERFQIQVFSYEYNTTDEITYMDGMTYDPAWSPRGDRIAFVSTHTGNDEIYTIDPEGAGQAQLTYNQWEWDKHPNWSPDGSQIVFYSNRDTGRRQIWIMNADGSNQRNLSNNEYEEWDPVWVR